MRRVRDGCCTSFARVQRRCEVQSLQHSRVRTSLQPLHRRKALGAISSQCDYSGLLTLCSVFRRNFATAELTNEAADHARRFFPPASGANEPKTATFASLVSRALQAGDAVELRAVGPRSAWHTLQSLAKAATVVEFEVTCVNDISAVDDGSDKARYNDRWSARVIARGLPGKRKELAPASVTAGGAFVSNETDFKKLARKLVVDFRDRRSQGMQSGPVVLHAYSDAERAAEAILRALATAGSDSGCRPVRCAVSFVERSLEEEVSHDLDRLRPALAPVDRILVRAWEDKDAFADPGFVLRPPGVSVAPQAMRKFQMTLWGRLKSEAIVSMECRGPHSASHSVLNLARCQGRTASVVAQWVSAPASGDAAPRPEKLAQEGVVAPNESVSPGKVDSAKEMTTRPVATTLSWIHLRVVSGQTWDEFNATDFKKTKQLIATPASHVGRLARSIGSELKQRGAVSVNAFSNDRAAIYQALKTLASLPVECDGLRVAFVPSIGRQKAVQREGSVRNVVEAKDAKDVAHVRVLRLYVTAASAANSGVRGA